MNTERDGQSLYDKRSQRRSIPVEKPNQRPLTGRKGDEGAVVAAVETGDVESLDVSPVQAAVVVVDGEGRQVPLCHIQRGQVHRVQTQPVDGALVSLRAHQRRLLS